MKLWEVLKALEENREKKYKMVSIFGKIHEIGLDHNGYYTFSTIYNVKNIETEPGGLFGGNIYPEDDWQEVKQPVPWQEAIEAWANGKTIKCTMQGSDFIFDGYKPKLRDQIDTIGRIQLREGTWYIED